MGKDLKSLIKELVKYTMVLALIGSIITFPTLGLKYSLCLIFGAIISLIGFILSSWSLNNTLNHNKGRFLPIIINISKAIIIAAICGYLFILDVKFGICFLVGFILIFIGLIIHGVNLK